MLLTMGMVLLAWGLLIVAFCGLGYAIFALCRFETIRDRFFYAFWTGFCLVLFLLQLWHFVHPIDSKILLLILIIGICCFAVGVREIAGDLRKHCDRYHLLLVLGLLLFVANRAMAPIKLFDTGLYHLAVIQWDIAFPIVPGLGNLMDRFGMNNAYLLYHAMLEPFPFTRSFHIANGLLLVVLVFPMIASFLRVFRKEATVIDWFALIFLPATFGQILDHSEDTSPDLAIYVLCALMALHLFAVMASEKNEGQKKFDLFYASLLAATAVSVKLSAIVFAGAAVLVIVVRYRSGFAWLVPSLLMFAVWMAGSVLLSGYPIYPATIFPFSVDWKMPVDVLNSIQFWMKTSARLPVPDPLHVAKTRDWMIVWTEVLLQQRNRLFEILLPACLFIAGLAGLKKRSAISAWTIFPPIAGLIFWFQAPDPRFAAANFWWLVAVVWAPILATAQIRFRTLCVFLLAAFLAISRVYYAPFVVRTAPVQRYPVALTHYLTDSGLLLFVPKELNSCWESPFPCTGQPRRQLRLRRNDDLSGGFMIAR